MGTRKKNKSKGKSKPYVMARKPNAPKKSEAVENAKLAGKLLALGALGFIANSAIKNAASGMKMIKESKNPQMINAGVSLVLTGATAWVVAKSAKKDKKGMLATYGPAMLVGMGVESALSAADAVLDGKTENSQALRVAAGLSKVRVLPAGQTPPPAGGTPAGGTPAGGTPAGGTPAGGTTTPPASKPAPVGTVKAVLIQDTGFIDEEGKMIEYARIEAAQDGRLVHPDKNAVLVRTTDPTPWNIGADGAVVLREDDGEKGNAFFSKADFDKAMAAVKAAANAALNPMGSFDMGYEMNGFDVGYEMSGNPFGSPF